MSKKLKFSLVMPVRNEEESVFRSLSSVFNMTRLPDEIIIADGCSTDNTVLEIDKWRNKGVPIVIVDNPKVWVGGGRNLAIEKSKYDVIAVCDFGNTVHKDWAAEILKPFEEDSSVDMVGGFFRPVIETDFHHCVTAIQYFADYTFDKMTEKEKEKVIPKVILPGGLSVAFKKELWRRVGGFPEWLFKAQDKLFSRKAHNMGAKIIFAPKAVVYHHVRDNYKALFSQLFFYGKGNGQSRYLREHVIKIGVFYFFVLSMFLLGLNNRFLWIFAVLLFCAYLYKNGIRNLMKMSNKYKENYLKFFTLTVSVLVCRDIASILGNILGWLEWALIPRYKKKFYEYMNSDNKLRLVEY